MGTEDATPQAVEPDGETQRRAVCLMATSHYTVSGPIGFHASNIRPLLITADTDTGCNLISKDHLPEYWQRFIVEEPTLPELGDANRDLIHIEAVVHLSVRLGNKIYQLPFLIAEQLAVAALLGMSFMNQHMDEICCRSQEIDLHQGCTVPILKPHRGYRTKPDPSDGETPIATQRPRAKGMQETHTVRLTALQDVKQVRMASGIIEATPGKRFRVLLSNFSRHPRRFPKETVLRFATKNPIKIVTPDREVATHCGKGLHINTLEQSGTHEYETPNPTWADTASP